ncbi:hypothetical protein NDU88_004263 [Pleurodeles waltl]|uniref:Uncharacterized protein n=1 Tax=Pleurodeles waltl TaxID=8319 RepID=A0AAV7VK82_PLEWA|nr:hypothetical protein NDU88_004263 [Pleurodeles waltl]
MLGAAAVVHAKIAPKRSGWRAEGAGSLPIASSGDLVPENSFYGPRIGEKRIRREAQDGGRHLVFETGARIEWSERAARTAHSAGTLVHPQSPAPKPTPGGYEARRTAESLVRTRLG